MLIRGARSDTSILVSFFPEAFGALLTALVGGGGLAGRVAASMAARPRPNARWVKNRVKASIMRSLRMLTVRWPGQAA